MTHNLLSSLPVERDRHASSEPRKARTAIFEPPTYLTQIYWWAYAHPLSVRIFERDWLINAILWGNYERLRGEILAALGSDFSGRNLQVACVYGDFTARWLERVRPAGGTLDVIDALPVQTDGLQIKLGPQASLRIRQMDSAALDLPDAAFDRVAMFMLLHEQPEDWRRRTLAEAARVLKPGGRLVIADYARPDWRHPLRYLFPFVFWALEPFALDLWRKPLEAFCEGLPLKPATARRTFFGGLYQLVVFQKT